MLPVACSRGPVEVSEVDTEVQIDSQVPVVVAGPQSVDRHGARAAVLDAAKSGWHSEAVAERVKKKLLQFCRSVHGDPLEFLDDAFVCDQLQPTRLVDSYRDDLVSVREMGRADSDRYHGRTGAGEALAAAFALFENRAEVDIHAKVVDITTTGGGAIDTTVHWSASGISNGGIRQQRAVWNCRWTSDEKLVSITVSDYSELLATSEKWFADCTRPTLGANSSFAEQLSPGLNHWLQRIEKSHGMNLFARYGVSVGDVDGDLLDDVYVCQPGGLPNRLYVHQIDGTAVDRSREAGVDWLDHSSASLFVDVDNDRDQDLVVATVGGLLLLENGGRGVFAKRGVLPVRDNDVQSLVAADYDGDSDLDLYLCVGFASRSGNLPQFEYHDANDGGANLLFRNDGGWHFSDATDEVGLGENNRRHSLAAAWEDYDNDGDPDLYVANDYGQNCLYRNSGGQFRDVAAAAGVVDYGSGMSVSWGDYDRDGRMDLYVANMFSSAGRRVMGQPQFRPGEAVATRQLFRRFAKGNTLFAGGPEGSFRELDEAAGAEIGSWAWGSLFADLNSDGWEDLVVANGYISNAPTGDL